MPCTKSLSLTQAVAATVTPLTSAVYVQSTDTILGTSANYIVEFSATTGALIRAVRAIAPMYGPMWLGMIGAAPYLACYNDRSNQNALVANTNIDIFPINTTTLERGVGLGIQSGFASSPYASYVGPRQMLNIGTRIYFLYPRGSVVTVSYRELGNPAIWNQQNGSTGWWSEEMSNDTLYVYYCNPYSPEIARRNTSLAYDSGIDTTGYYPVSCVYTGADVYAVCGDKYLIKTNNWTAAAAIDLEADVKMVEAGITGIKPMRLRYNTLDHYLYIPVQNKHGIIVFDTLFDIVVRWIAGCASPVDVVFTASKQFAVQTSQTGLLNIT